MRTIKRGRFEYDHLTGTERPNRMYRYTVTGRGEFPFDMLRYDGAWPRSSEDATKMGAYANYAGDNGGLRSVRLKSHSEPTIDRWSSFGWSVGQEGPR